MSSVPGTPVYRPTQKILRRGLQPLDVFFVPSSVALIGATDKEGSVGRSLLTNLTRPGFGVPIYPINPSRNEILGIRAYPTVAAIPGGVELAVIATPAPTVPGVIEECVAAGVKGAIIISAGFREAGEKGVEREQEILRRASRGKLRIIGPNCLGVMSPVTGINATFAGAMALAGSVGFLSQSGALCTAVLDWSLRELVGFSAFVSLGSMLDVGWGDLIDYLGDDPHTQSIVIYMESVGDARAFLSAAREVALRKPIIIIKAGRTEAAARAAASHTGSLAGSDEVLDAAFRRCGVLRVNRIADLFYMADVLAKQPRPRGPRLVIVTNAGGPGVLATDSLIAEGGMLAALSPETMQALDQLLPRHWSHANPIDILGDADATRYQKAVEIVARDPANDGLLVVLTPQAMSDPTETAQCLAPFGRSTGKPLLASWMGGSSVAEAERILAQASIPTFPYPDSAARAFLYMWQHSSNLRSLYETPALVSDRAADLVLIGRIIGEAREAGRTLLTEPESKQLLAAYGIPTVPTSVARSEQEAVQVADRIGYPVVLKVLSQTITHKSDVGGVRLNLGDAAAVREAWRAIESAVRERASDADFLGVSVQPMISTEGYELILGSSIDPQFGPVLLFGAGGQLVEIFKDHALGLPPLNSTLARRLMEGTRIYTALGGVRGRKPVDLGVLEEILVRFSRLVVGQPWIREIDINPLLASAERLVALDARVVLHGSEVREEQLPRPAIRPYPAQYSGQWALPDGTAVSIRPIRPEDEPAVARFHATLSKDTVFFRYFHVMGLGQRTGHEQLARVCFLDYDREVTLVAEIAAAPDGPQVIALAQLIRLFGSDAAEAAVLVSDPLQGKGLGTELTRRLVAVARQEEIRRVTADILPENHLMQGICRKLGFTLQSLPQEQVIRAELLL